ncbi:hypothetical protein PYJP_17210 [Pyrofollis japonicus]|uniref:hypothetical protein n=1 Tax=Pyrofollis japonicus TaxID=3060460 RepID=UPI00295BE5F4|nr:hypothetical protein [Pyrofollis japonicus]BEP18369.1 hypothetical protein PYJP_17210 [Pyrofollis japonicus]
MGKAMSALKAIFYLVVIAGIAFFIVDLYYTRSGWSTSLAEKPEIQPQGTNIRINLVLDIYNPSHSEVRAKLVWYSIYLDNEYVGEGLKPYLDLKPGHNKVRLSVTIDTLRLPCAVAEALSKGNVTVSVKGYAIITLMLFGKVGYKDITVPINTQPYKEAVKLDPVTKRALGIVTAMCELAKTGKPAAQWPPIPGTGSP